MGVPGEEVLVVKRKEKASKLVVESGLTLELEELGEGGQEAEAMLQSPFRGQIWH